MPDGVPRRARSLLAVALVWAGVAACSDGSSLPTAGPDASTATEVITSLPATGGPSDAADAPGVTAEPGPGAGSDAAGPPVTTECATAARVVEADLAVALLPADHVGADAARTELEAAIEALAGTSTRMAPAARVLLRDGIDDDDGSASRGRTLDVLNTALARECRLRLAGLGHLRPDPDPDDALRELGVARVVGDTCEVVSQLRWADAHWRLAPNGGEQDRYGVIVRHALGVLRIDDGAALDLDLALPDSLDRADLSGWSLDAASDLAVVRMDARLRRACGRGLEPSGLLMEGLGVPSATALASLEAPAWAEPGTVDADTAHGRWCAVVDDLYARDLVASVGADLGLADDRRAHDPVELRLLLGALRIASRSGGSVASLDDVRDVIATTRVIERADLSEPGALSYDERRAVGELDAIMVANCGAGFAVDAGVLGRFGLRSDWIDVAPTPSIEAPANSVPETSEPPVDEPVAVLTDTEVMVVGDSLTLGAETEIVAALRRIGLSRVAVDGQVSRRMTSGTDTVRSGVQVIEEVTALSSPRVWVIALGTNDVASGVSADALRDSVRRVLDAIPDDALVVWVDTYLRDEAAATISGNAIIREVVGQRPGSYVADFFSYGDDAGVVVSDGVHLTDLGRAVFAEVIAAGIATVVERNPQFDLTIVPPPTTTAAPSPVPVPTVALPTVVLPTPPVPELPTTTAPGTTTTTAPVAESTTTTDSPTTTTTIAPTTTTNP